MAVSMRDADETTHERVRILVGDAGDAAILDRAVTFRDLIALGLVTRERAVSVATVRPAVRRRTESVTR